MSIMEQKVESHERFEELNARASVGQLSAVEYAELQVHLQECPECQKYLTEYNWLVREQLPLLNPTKTLGAGLISISLRGGGYRKRFLERARAEGINVGTSADTGWGLWETLPSLASSRALRTYGLAVVLLSCLGVLGYRWREAKFTNHVQQTEVARLSSENETLRRQVSDLTRRKDMTEAQLAAELSRTRKEREVLAAKYWSIEQALEQAKSTVKNLNAEAESLRELDKQTYVKLQQSQTKVAHVTEELVALRDARDQQVASADELRLRLSELEQNLAQTTQSLDRTRRLLEADRDIRDLMGARSLLITDVYDVDETGRTRKSFGRVFYTQGKSLIFYAFDLGDPKTVLAKHSYQLWGYHETTNPQALSLGVLYLEDRTQNRWALKFSDPGVLEEINAVFVTVEPPGGSDKPTGKKRLYAYLAGNANHP